MDYLSLLQWPAMVCSVLAAWLVASQQANRRQHGFWWFLASNILWSVWGMYDRAWAVIVLQLALAFLNIRGLRKNSSSS
jgi:hypothetical protein